MSIKSFFATAPKPADAAAAAAATVPSKRYELRFSRSSKVVEWDDALFTDCRPSEAEDAQAGVRVLQGSLLGTGYSDYVLFCQLCSHAATCEA